MKRVKHEKAQTMVVPSVFHSLFWRLLSYRFTMTITEITVSHSAFYGKTGFYLCPRCRTALERDFQPYCDHCGQHLDWNECKKAIITSCK